MCTYETRGIELLYAFYNATTEMSQSYIFGTINYKT